ncbi:formimidoylglutamate deiminase [Rhodoplanes serenus]|uniref:Formimidoylglutamate deiminase n=1 Tax=Rhodoplanes serenus TaxID=200615 RepID=A0A9X4XLZ4_9BRAD|nr:formimidoylglutamate deiminase [Rhodoplanes serenus]MTW17605.1 formimidoylglutamate deiminase [Rhodoplanes serenus]
MTGAFLLAQALLPHGFAQNVRVEIADGRFIAVEPGAAVAPGTERIAGLALPGVPNLHCHAFQRGMAGLAERRGPASDSFWTWREVMYRFLARLTPDDAEAIAAFAYMQMLERGFTAVAEFHYLHHDIDGRPYADLGEMAGRMAAAAHATGIGLTLLPSLYGHGGFGGAPPVEGQRRFLNDPDRFARLVARSREIVAAVPSGTVGVAPHSLRAVTPETLRAAVALAPGGPIHIHAAEQVKEVEDCVAWSGRRPVAWLLDEMPVDARWCLIHTTHTTPDETVRLARAGAVAGLCPLTEASLGDGIFDGARYLETGGRFGIGTDSNIDIDPAGELRQLEYSQRLAHRARNVMATAEGESTGRRLLGEALAGGAQALGQPIGAIAVGRRADLVVLDTTHPDLAAVAGDATGGRSIDRLIDLWLFVAGREAVTTVMASGEIVVRDGHHRARQAITARYLATLRRILAA